MATSTRPSTQTATRVAGWLAPEEFRILEALCDTLLPTLTPPTDSSEPVADYYRRNAGDLHVALVVAETLAQEDSTAQTDFRQFLALLATPATSLLFVGQAKAFADLGFAQREKYLQALANSPIAQLRQGFQAIKRLAGFIFFSVPDQQGQNPNWSVFEYQPADPVTSDQPRPIQPLTISDDTILECDAVIVGSGAGGGVVAGELARDGKNVIVLERGGYYSPADLSMGEAQATAELFLQRGLCTSKDLGVVVLAGSNLGGGTTVNWTTSFRTPPDVLDEWSQVSGLGFFTNTALQASFTAVEQRLQVNKQNSQHNRQHQIFLEGAQALGYATDTIPRNALGCEERCGSCCYGCRYGCKQSTTQTYLQDAYKQGARIIVRCHADKVIIEDRKAIGVEATAHDPTTSKHYKLTVYSKAVIAAAGALNTPALLLRSDIPNKHIGRHLHLHPTSVISGHYQDKIYPWRGVMQSAYSDAFSHLDGNYGYILETPPSHPGLMGLSTPWLSARSYRENMAQGASTANIIVITRDKGEGTITLNRANESVINYVTAVIDRHHLLHGLRTAARMHMAAGAQELFSLHTKSTRLQRPASGPVSESAFRNFDAALERHGLGPNHIMMFTAHQMGSCRMGADAKKAVTNEHGEVYDVKGLFVCDSSVFPAASGVNPMLSIMALAHHSSQYIKTVI